MNVYIDTFKRAESIVDLCKMYKPSLEIDVRQGQYTVNGCSLLAVISFVESDVEIIATPKHDKENSDWIIEEFYKNLEDIMKI